MCLIALALDVHPRHRLVLAANRDEARARPTAPAARWADAPHVLAGRDLLAGGTWMGVARGDAGYRWAALTNIRDLRRPPPPDARSRGALVADFLRGPVPAAAYAARAHDARAAYAGFNLLVGDAGGVWFVSSAGDEPRALAPGVYGLSNASLDTPWPKLTGAVADLRAALADDPVDPEALLALLDDRATAPDDALPDTGLGRAWERVLSARFITGADYGTRAQMALVLDRAGGGTFVERTVGPAGPDPAPRVFTL